MWSLTQGHTLFWRITLFVLIVASCIVNSQIGVRDFNYVEQFCHLRIGHVIRCMRSVCKRVVSCIIWEMSELITQEGVFKLGGGVDHVTRHV